MQKDVGPEPLNILYTLPDCPNCESAKKILAEYQEVAINGETEGLVREMVGDVIAPILVRNGQPHILVQLDGCYGFVRVLHKSEAALHN